MRHGDLVSIPGYARKGVALEVTRRDIAHGTNVLRPGLYIFSGYWYGNKPLDIASYGKIHGQAGKPVGRVRTHQQALKMCR